MRVRILTFDSLVKGGPFIGPKGGLYEDPAHKIPYDSNKHGAVHPSKCPRCRGVAHIISRQRAIGGKDKISAAPCRTCNPKGKYPLDPKKLKAIGLPMPDKRRSTAPPEREQPAQPHQMTLDFKRPQQLTLVRAMTGSPFKLHGKIDFQGLDIAIENRVGSKRRWKDENGNEGHTVMVYPYGYIRGVEGADGDEVDVYVGPSKKSELVFIVNQRAIWDARKFDEHKVMLGFDSEKKAREAYLKHYQPRELGERLLGSIRTWTMGRFKRWLDGRAKAREVPVRKSFVVYQ